MKQVNKASIKKKKNAQEIFKEFQQGNDKAEKGFWGPQIIWLILKTPQWFSKLR